jgi:hypothetical protein
LTSAAKSRHSKQSLIAAVNRCATQWQTTKDVFSEVKPAAEIKPVIAALKRCATQNHALDRTNINLVVIGNSSCLLSG